MLRPCLVRVWIAAAAVALLNLSGIAFAADADFDIQGEYSGEVGQKNEKLGIQVIALGKGKFRAVGYHGGLPGDGWDGSEKMEADGETKDGVTKFVGTKGSGTISQAGSIAITDKDGNSVGTLKKIERKSPSLGLKPPTGAVVLFDGTSGDAFENGRVEDGLLVAGVTSKQKFQSCLVHLEFRTPFMPEATGQARGNSGCYLQGRYEVQVLDSFGLAGKQNECGGIYSIKDPDVNMCFPPMSWQTYDIEYTAAKYDGDKKVANAKMTVKHNGVVVQKDVELTHATTAAPVKEGPEPGPIYLQDHGNPVRYRNVWLVAK